MDAWLYDGRIIRNRMDFGSIVLMSEAVIHTVTLLDIQDVHPVIVQGTKITERQDRRIVATRCVGFEVAYEDALQAVLANNGDMHELRWNYIVIEKVDRGMWRVGKPVAWFAWNEVLLTWEQTPCPKFLENVRSFSIG
jgi:hypothetical protein